MPESCRNVHESEVIFLSEIWYEIVPQDEVLNQGDILIGCPIIVPEHPTSYLALKEQRVTEAKAKVYFDNVVVLTQGCLIAGPNGPKVEMVTVAQISEVRGEGWGFVSDVRKGKRPPYHLLNKFEQDGMILDYQIVEFANTYSIPYKLLDDFRLNVGPRLRLKSPYLEELAQRYGLFFSKVGLPNGAIDEEDLKRVAAKS